MTSAGARLALVALLALTSRKAPPRSWFEPEVFALPPVTVKPSTTALAAAGIPSDGRAPAERIAEYVGRVQAYWNADVALSAEDVAKRPDVLVVESGEILLPGDVHMKNIGLPPGVAYACLAETIVLALEGRYETFTIGRNIEWEKVKEIYKLGLKHGMKLATISGVNGVYTDEDLARVRDLALAKRDEMAEA